MRVKCLLCDKIDNLNDESPLSKKLRNRPIHTYMCNECSDRIKARTEERKATGKFKLFNPRDYEEDW